MNLAEFIRSKRGELKMSQRQLGIASGLSNTVISKIENGERTEPDVDTLRKLAFALNVKVIDLMKLVGYLEETIDHGKYTEHVFTNGDGEIIDIFKELNDLPEAREHWVGTAFRAASKLSEEDFKKLDRYANILLQKAELEKDLVKE
ncbi:MAG: helix-turn-helix transcriptional regulator [Syntrophomonas sp.]|nr:helix-turn-helix transcriptional regulator [Proteiniphilum sp.]MDD3878979.1 helix-turn-helix transcriptional regulator [Syntrophomonas sp.]